MPARGATPTQARATRREGARTRHARRAPGTQPGRTGRAAAAHHLERSPRPSKGAQGKRRAARRPSQAKRKGKAPAAGSAARQGLAEGVRRRGLVTMLRTTAEGRLFALGLVGLLVLGAELTVLTILAPAMGGGLLSMVSVELFAGREGAIPLGLGGGAPAWLVAQVSATQDLVAVALVYPLFLYAVEKYHERDNWFMRRVRRIDEAAAKRRKLVDKWGAAGLGAFMLVPFLVNGPLVGAIAGRLAGVGRRAIAVAVIGATVLSALAWSYFYKGMQSLFPQFDQTMSFIVTGVILGLIVLIGFVVEWRGKRKRQAA